MVSPKVIQKIKENISTWLLMIAMFLNPMGFDIVQYWLISQTGSLWRANAVLYFVAAVLFGLSIYFRRRFKIKPTIT